MKKNILICFFVLALWNCNNKTEWDYSNQQKFLEGCNSTSEFSERKEAMCLCSLDLIRKKYSFSEYAKEEAKMFMGNASDEFMSDIVDIAIECAQRDYE